jgi:hypothetical protein
MARQGEARQGNNNIKQGRANIMEKIRLRFIGESAMLQHNVRMANPLDPYAKALKAISGKRKKTDKDLEECARVEWEGGLYLYDGIVQIPNRVVNKCMERGATKQSNGTRWKSGAIVDENCCPLKYKGVAIKTNGSKAIPNPDLNKYYEDHKYQTMVRVGQSTLLRTRPIFYDWFFEFGVYYDPNVLNINQVLQAAEDAGRLVGLGDWRPEKSGGNFGRFSVEIVK